MSSAFYSSAYLGFLTLVSLIVAHADAGFSTEVCDSMNPAHTASVEALPVLTRSADTSLYSIDIESKPYYRINSNLVVKLEGGPFTQFIMQARKLGVQNSVTASRIGSFIDPLPDEAMHLECDGPSSKTVVTHTDNSSKTSLSFNWKAPSSDQGTFEFIATVVNATGYWTEIKSLAINFRVFPPDLTDCGKSVGCFIHQTSDEDDCVEGGCDVVVKSDQTDDGKLVTLTMGRKSPKDSGFVGIGFADDKDDMKGMVLMACIKHFNNFNIKSYFLENPDDGFQNTTTYISSTKNQDVDGMMWCKFQFQLSNTYPINKDLSKAQFRFYLTGKLDKDHKPHLEKSKVLVSEEPMSLNDIKFIKYTADSGGATVNSISLLISLMSLLLFFLIR